MVLFTKKELKQDEWREPRSSVCFVYLNMWSPIIYQNVAKKGESDKDSTTPISPSLPFLVQYCPHFTTSVSWTSLFINMSFSQKEVEVEANCISERSQNSFTGRSPERRRFSVTKKIFEAIPRTLILCVNWGMTARQWTSGKYGEQCQHCIQSEETCQMKRIIWGLTLIFLMTSRRRNLHKIMTLSISLSGNFRAEFSCFLIL